MGTTQVKAPRIVGEVSEVRRSETELCVEWKIPRFLHLIDCGDSYYDTPSFDFYDARWHLRVRPNFASHGEVSLYLCRGDDAGPYYTRTVIASLGVRGSGGGVERRREERREFGKFDCWHLDVCAISDLREQKDSLAPGGALTVVCQMEVPGATVGDDQWLKKDVESLKERIKTLKGTTEVYISTLESDPISTAEQNKCQKKFFFPSFLETECMDNELPQTEIEHVMEDIKTLENIAEDMSMMLGSEPISSAQQYKCQDKLTFAFGLEKGASGVLVTFSYKELQTVTQNFGDLPLQAGGCKIGEGGFGIVYRAVIGDAVVAVKRLKDSVDKQFMTELMTLTNYKHENLLPLIGFSLCPTDEHQCCLLYEYMQKGSLEDRLACADGSEPLSWRTRLSISYGTALGINHLHTFGEKPMVHRDIKSANILLDQNFVPKVGDFGLVRTGSRGVRSSSKVSTENNSGTSVYMPREAFMGDVSIKWDTFSFGVILLELLTGLPPFDPNREDKDLVTHMASCQDIRPSLDPRADWNREAATELYGIARKRCLVQSRKERSTISEILEDLSSEENGKKYELPFEVSEDAVNFGENPSGYHFI